MVPTAANSPKLASLSLDARKIEYLGPAELGLYGRSIPASRFEFLADIIVQTSCSLILAGEEIRWRQRQMLPSNSRVMA